MHPKEKEIITKHFSSDKIMLEWGSGGSTIEFSPQLKKYYSNINYNFVAQNLPMNPDGRQSEYNQFKDYIDIVESFNLGII